MNRNQLKDIGLFILAVLLMMVGFAIGMMIVGKLNF